MLVDGGRFLLVIAEIGYPESLALASGHCLGTWLPKERYLAATLAADLLRLVVKVHW